jgi:hypothetical protein
MRGQESNFTATNVFAGVLFAVNLYLGMFYTKQIKAKLRRILSPNDFSIQIHQN